MATITVSAQEVISAAKHTIALIESNRQSANEDMIRKVMQSSRIGSWFRYYLPNREQAIKILMEDMWGFYPSQMHSYDLDHAKKLLTLAMHGDPVVLNENDCKVLF